MDLGMRDRVALVTGGGQNIGAEICVTLAQEGARIAVNDVVAERATAVSTRIGDRAIGVVADVTDAEAVSAMMRTIVQKWGRIDILVNNAGLPLMATYREPTPGGGSLFHTTDRPSWDRTMGVITYGVLNCTRAVIDGMRERRWGRIINVVSDAGRVGAAGLAAYSLAKAGIVGFTKALAQEVGSCCITVNCVSPALIETETARDFIRAQGREMVALHPMGQGLGRLGQPSDVANAVAFLASERAEWITGQVLSVNGGMQMPD